MFVAVDWNCKFAFVRLEKRAKAMTARAFLEPLIEAVPDRIHLILIDNGIQFAPLPKDCKGATVRFFGHPFGNLCRDHEIEHRLTKPKHPCTSHLVERVNRTIKDATTNRFHFEDHDQLGRHLSDFIDARNFARRLKTLKVLTPCEFICRAWAAEPERLSGISAPGTSDLISQRRVSGSS